LTWKNSGIIGTKIGAAFAKNHAWFWLPLACDPEENEESSK
jgi:hypothetical protein